MPKPKPHEFRIRMSPDLMAIIEDAKGQKSVNRQINDWLWSKAAGDHADRIADALRPVLASLTEEDRARLVGLVIEAAQILSGGKSRAGSRKMVKKP